LSRQIWCKLKFSIPLLLSSMESEEHLIERYPDSVLICPACAFLKKPFYLQELYKSVRNLGDLPAGQIHTNIEHCRWILSLADKLKSFPSDDHIIPESLKRTDEGITIEQLAKEVKDSNAEESLRRYGETASDLCVLLPGSQIGLRKKASLLHLYTGNLLSYLDLFDEIPANIAQIKNNRESVKQKKESIRKTIVAIKRDLKSLIESKKRGWSN